MIMERIQRYNEGAKKWVECTWMFYKVNQTRYKFRMIVVDTSKEKPDITIKWKK